MKKQNSYSGELSYSVTNFIFTKMIPGFIYRLAIALRTWSFRSRWFQRLPQS